jgi:dolichol-phosphate mannosyltransferase
MQIAVVIPAFRVSKHILSVLRGIGPEVSHIFVVDDACPEESGKLVIQESQDPRVQVIFHEINQGVGAASVTGYKMALQSESQIVVKLDGDGQMDPSLIPNLVRPIVEGRADYTKGNRFDSLAGLREMPSIRVLGNGGLSLLNKVASGYWDITDPTNGFTAIHSETLRLVPTDMLSKRYFFESDMLFRLSILRAVVWDVPMQSKYGSESSNLSIAKSLIEFPVKHFVNFHKRLFYNYYLRDMSAASIELPVGTALGWFGLIFGITQYFESIDSGVPATAGTVMFAAVPLILGLQLVLSFLNHDISAVPRKPRQAFQ